MPETGHADFGFVFEIAWEVVNKGTCVGFFYYLDHNLLNT